MSGSEKALYSLDIKGEGILVSRKIEEAQARAILDIIFGGKPPMPATTAAGNITQKLAGAAAKGTRISLREALDDAVAKANPEKIVVIGNYAVAYEGMPDFGREDVRSRFRSAGEAAPANLHRDFSAAIQNGWIAEDPQKPGRFYVTQKGKSAIDDKFSRKITNKPTARKKPSS